MLAADVFVLEWQRLSFFLPSFPYNLKNVVLVTIQNGCWIDDAVSDDGCEIVMAAQPATCKYRRNHIISKVSFERTMKRNTRNPLVPFLCELTVVSEWNFIFYLFLQPWTYRCYDQHVQSRGVNISRGTVVSRGIYFDFRGIYWYYSPFSMSTSCFFECTWIR